jgi:hypothetical protein
MKEIINKMIEEQFGTSEVLKKLWFVMTDDSQNVAKLSVDEEVFFLPAVMLEGFRGNTAVDALVNFRRCHNSKRVYGVVETVEEAKKLMPDATIIDWNGRFIQE